MDMNRLLEVSHNDKHLDYGGEGWGCALLTIALIFFFGLGIVLGITKERAERQTRLVGYCSGKIIFTNEEDKFPSSGCKWIERYQY